MDGMSLPQVLSLKCGPHDTSLTASNSNLFCTINIDV